ncbi:low temperature requirement protein A [Micromonospora sp. SL1-18]|uniref:low temperature requirement protein A n=1 Tax=Micromonospora sp. SL1-18 TaxID=3399128 RepID=UPI003A4D9060
MLGDPRRLLPKGESTGRASFLELFFDLAFVFALTQVVSRGVDGLIRARGVHDFGINVVSAAKVIFLLLALWAVWQGTAWTTSRYDPYHPTVQLVVLIALVASLVMGVGTLRAFGGAGATFVAGYVIAQVSRPLLLAIALRGDERQRLKVRMLITYAATAVLWILGVLLAGSGARLFFWGPALAIEYLANRFGWPVPGLGRSAPARWSIAGAHLAERYQQFFLVALGEVVLVTGLTYVSEGRSLASTVAFAVAVGKSILIWRIYFYRAGQILAEAVQASPTPARIGQSAADSHMIMIAGVIVRATRLYVR